MTAHQIQRLAPRGYKVDRLSEQLGPKRIVSFRATPTGRCSKCGAARSMVLPPYSRRHEYP